MDATKRAYLELHIAVFLWGFTAILGDLISLSALSLVWWRVLITSCSLIFLLRSGSAFRKLSRKTILQFAFVGALTGVHWLTFFGAIKLSNASITLVCMATTAFFTAIIEPLVLRTKNNWWEIGLGFLVIPGMALVVDNVDVSMHAGIWVGLTSAFLAAVFSILNKKWIQNAEPLSITFIEMSSAWLLLSLFLPFYFHNEPAARLLPSLKDLGMLLVLALACTTLTWVLALRALKHLSAFASTLTVNLEPVYGIFLAWVILHEDKELSAGFYWGVLLILVVVFSYPVFNKKFGRNSI
ncbi:MAG: DMT family transporter [Lewinellaceae bacterium]|nr:DMT family transporter [Saprospiraceae bacterium]MCB9336534.1 DMT family transporter [Lewinellaceae bacterium]